MTEVSAEETPAEEVAADETPAHETPADEEAAAEDDPLELMWARALEKWDDEKRHAVLLELALQTERMPELAGRYRALLGDVEKGPVAKKRIDAILGAATQLLMSMKTPKPTKNPPWLVASAAITFAITMAYLAYALFRR